MSIDPPPCPPWCRAVHPTADRGWIVSPVDITRTCRHVIDVQSGDQAHEITLERFAAVSSGGALHIADAIVRLDGGDAMDLDEALLLSDCLRRVVELAHEPVLAA